MHKLKIAYIIPRFHPFKGGAEVNIEALAVRAARDGHDVIVLTTNAKFRDETPMREEEYKGVKIIRMNAWWNALYAGFYPELLNHLRKNEYDVIHVSGIGFLWREFCLRVTKKKYPNTTYMCTPHGPFMALEDTKGIRGLARSIYTKELKRFLNNVFDIFIAVNPHQHTWMESLYGIDPKKIHVIPNGIDKKYIVKNLYEEKFTKKPVITFVGRLANYKGPHYVVEAIAALLRSKAEIPAFEFWILGRSQGEYTEFLKNLISKYKLDEMVKIIFSPTDEERDEALFKHSHIHILPSKWEATGIVLLEAMAQGNAIVSTTQNEAHELLIDEGVNGFTYDYDNVDSLKEILKKLLTNPDLVHNMAQSNLEKIQNFTWDEIYKKYKAILEDK